MAELTELLRMPSPIREEETDEKMRRIALQTMHAKRALKEMKQKSVEMGIVRHASTQTDNTSSVGEVNPYSNYIAALERRCGGKKSQRCEKDRGLPYDSGKAGYRRVFETNGVLRVNIPTEKVDLS